MFDTKDTDVYHARSNHLSRHYIALNGLYQTVRRAPTESGFAITENLVHVHVVKRHLGVIG